MLQVDGESIYVYQSESLCLNGTQILYGFRRRLTDLMIFGAEESVVFCPVVVVLSFSEAKILILHVNCFSARRFFLQ
jgi:hypothetical protein